MTQISNMASIEYLSHPIFALDHERLTYLSTAGEHVFEDHKKLYLPANVIPELFSPERLAAIHEACLKLGARVDVAIYTTVVDGRRVPMHVCTEILYRGKRIIGPVLISLAHRIVVHPDLELEKKREIVTKSIRALRPLCDGIIISMPQRKEGSFTHSIFSDEKTLGSICFSNIEKHNMYYFFETNWLSLELLNDPNFQEICGIISTLWSRNFKEIVPHLPDTQYDINEYISEIFPSS